MCSCASTLAHSGSNVSTVKIQQGLNKYTDDYLYIGCLSDRLEGKNAVPSQNCASSSSSVIIWTVCKVLYEQIQTLNELL